MATIKERPDSYCVRGIIKRDFQHDHSGPEELPHRKKGKGKKFCKKYKGPHVYDKYTEWNQFGTWRYRYVCCACGKRTMYGYQSQRLVEAFRLDGTKYSRWI